MCLSISPVSSSGTPISYDYETSMRRRQGAFVVEKATRSGDREGMHNVVSRGHRRIALATKACLPDRSSAALAFLLGRSIRRSVPITSWILRIELDAALAVRVDDHLLHQPMSPRGLTPGFR